MNFSDRIAVRLGDPGQRSGVLDQEALAGVVAAAYDADQLAVEGPYTAQFDELRFGVARPATATADGVWSLVGSTDRTEASFVVAGISTQGARVDALWRGAVTARVIVDRAEITEVHTSVPALGTIDADIARELGALPDAPDELEAERRERLIERMRSGLDQPGAFGDEDLDAVLHAVGTATVGGLLQTPAHPAAVSVGFSPAPPPVSSPLSLPIAAPLLVRDADVSILQLLADSYEVRSRLEPLGLERAMTQPLPRREPLPVVWVVPAELFDDPDWPGAEPDMSPSEARAARRSSAGGWLAAQGIALATAPT